MPTHLASVSGTPRALCLSGRQRASIWGEAHTQTSHQIEAPPARFLPPRCSDGAINVWYWYKASIVSPSIREYKTASDRRPSLEPTTLHDYAMRRALLEHSVWAVARESLSGEKRTHVNFSLHRGPEARVPFPRRSCSDCAIDVHPPVSAAGLAPLKTMRRAHSAETTGAVAREPLSG
ncbi:hypothetical protein BDN67DRAFT_982549 [Paxillus ammoniavirescens]|nr:hypothetical protein BDN67DRAFT_982549 [Paxillus ammoniavirescens]